MAGSQGKADAGGVDRHRRLRPRRQPSTDSCDGTLFPVMDRRGWPLAARDSSGCLATLGRGSQPLAIASDPSFPLGSGCQVRRDVPADGPQLARHSRRTPRHGSSVASSCWGGTRASSLTQAQAGDSVGNRQHNDQGGDGETCSAGGLRSTRASRGGVVAVGILGRRNDGHSGLVQGGGERRQ